VLTRGARCLGRSFAIANIKALLATLVRRFAFELPGGPKTAIGVAQTIVARPTIAGEARFAIPVRVRRFVD
jgi:cytochrome P450